MFYSNFSSKTRRNFDLLAERQTRACVAHGHVATSALFSRALLIGLLVLAGCSIILPEANAAGPIVTTLPATNVTATSALLRGTVNPAGFATTWDFSNPPTTKIYCPSPPGNLPADNTTHPVSCTATGLTPSTYYEYIIRASNSQGNSFGTSVGFTTAAAGGPPTVVTLSATDVTATSAILRGSVNPNGLATTWDFSNPPTTKIYCPSPPSSLPGDNVPHSVSCTATGLTPSTYYEYIIRASNSAGSAFGLSVGFTTAAATATTDWALSSPTLSAASPKVDDAVTFNVVLMVLSTNQPYPQTFTITAQLDGVTIAGGPLSYSGPTGSPMNVHSTPPWTATVGSHTIVWQVSGGVTDPNPANNVATYTFTVGPAPAQFDFDLSVSPTERTVAPGGTASYTVAVNLASGSSQLVTLSLSGEPGGITGAFSPSSGSPSFSSSLTLNVASSASPGSYSLTIAGTGGGRTHTATVMLIVSEVKDFRVEATPASATVNQGETASYSVNIIGLHGFDSQVSLSATGLPTGASHAFSIPSGTPDFTSTLTVTLPSNVQTGTFTIAIKGSGGGLERLANIVLLISPRATQTQTPIQTETTTQTSDLLDILQQNSLLLLGGLLVLVVIGAVVLRLRSKQPPPPPGNPCPTCNKPMTFIKEYDRWYCHNCKEYK